MTDIEWKPFSLTHVEYPSGDLVGKFLALGSLIPIFLIVAFITLILFRRDLHTICFFVGIVLNELVNLILKHTIQHPRPFQRQDLYTEYGMPSSHSQLIWFFVVYSILFLIFRLHHISGSLIDMVGKAVVGLGLLVAACLVSYSRIYLLYHSWSQVLCGALVGGTLGASWFTLVHLILTPIFPIVASWNICELLMVRDTTLIPNILWFEYTHARQENRARSRKLISMKSQ